MEKWSLRTLLAILTCFVPLGSARAEDGKSLAVPAETKFVLQVNLQGFRDTKIGRQLFDLAKREALKELGENLPGKKSDKSDHDSEDEDDSSDERLSDKDIMEKISKMLGFDPFEEIRDITIASSDYEHPERSLVAIVRLGKSTGNLEGLMLGLPGYESDNYHQHQIHSAAPDKDQRVFAAVQSDDDGNKAIVIAPQRAGLENLLDQLDGKSTSASDRRAVSRFSADHTLLSLHVLSIPMDKIGEGPQANVAKIIDDLSFQVSEKDDTLEVNVRAHTKKEEQAEQLRQMAQGLVAMIDFAQSADPDDEDLQKVRELAKDMEASRDGTEVKMGFHIPTEALTKLIESELKD